MNKVKKTFNQVGRRASRVSSNRGSVDSTYQRDRMPSIIEDGGANGHIDEHTSLLGRMNPNSHSQYMDDDRAWVKWPMSFYVLTWRVLTSSYVNVLLVLVPPALIVGFLGLDPTLVFVLNFLAIIPLAALLAYATEQFADHVGQTLGGIANATLGNAVEVLVSYFALRNNEVRIVQASMLGSILSNILLVLGCCFIAGGIPQMEQGFNSTVASTMSSLMAVASASLVLPAALYAALQTSKQSSEGNILILSHGTSVILLVLYILYLFFQLKTHKQLFDGDAQAKDQGQEQGLPTNEVEHEEEEHEEPLGLIPSVVTLTIVTVLVAVCADYLVQAIEPIVKTTGLSKTFIGLILIPIVGNAAEHVTAVIVAYKNKMDLAINVAIGSSMQIALFVTPLMVLLGWAMGVNMTLHFHLFETVTFILSVWVVNYLIQDGKSNYLEGAMCLGMYAIIALAFFVYPDDATGSG